MTAYGLYFQAETRKVGQLRPDFVQVVSDSIDDAAVALANGLPDVKFSALKDDSPADIRRFSCQGPNGRISLRVQPLKTSSSGNTGVAALRKEELLGLLTTVAGTKGIVSPTALDTMADEIVAARS